MPVFRDQPELLEAFRRGERRALELVYRTYVRTVEVYLKALIRAVAPPEFAQPSAVADTLQEVFVKAFSPTAREAYDCTRDFGPYLRRIAKNYFVDQLRAHDRELRFSVEALPDPALEVLPVADAVADPRVSAVMAMYLATLSPGLRGVYEQRFVFGHSQEQSCNVLGITRRRLRTEEARLIAGLRKALGNQGIRRGDVSVEPSLARSLGPHAAG